MGRSHLPPFPIGSIAASPLRDWALGPMLREGLNWWIAITPASKPRTVAREGANPVYVYTDSSGKGHPGFVVVDPVAGTRTTLHTHGPSCDTQNHLKIYEFELLASIIGLIVDATLYPGRPILFFCDNTAANAIIVRGPNRTWVGRFLRSVFWPLAAHFGVPTWIEYANTTINPPDGPSRMRTLSPPNLRPALLSIRR